MTRRNKGEARENKTYNDKIANPAQTHRKRDTLGPQRRREYLGGDSPAHGSPARSVGKHKDQHEGHTHPRLGLVRGPVAGKLAAQRRRDDVAREHARGADEQELASADGVHGPQAGQDADELHNVEDAGHDQLHVVVEAHFPAGQSVFISWLLQAGLIHAKDQRWMAVLTQTAWESSRRGR